MYFVMTLRLKNSQRKNVFIPMHWCNGIDMQDVYNGGIQKKKDFVVFYSKCKSRIPDFSLNISDTFKVEDSCYLARYRKCEKSVYAARVAAMNARTVLPLNYSEQESAAKTPSRAVFGKRQRQKLATKKRTAATTSTNMNNNDVIDNGEMVNNAPKKMLVKPNENPGPSNRLDVELVSNSYNSSEQSVFESDCSMEYSQDELEENSSDYTSYNEYFDVPETDSNSESLIDNEAQTNLLPIGPKTVLNPINAHGSKDSIESKTHEIPLPIGPPPVSASFTSKNATIPIASIENKTQENLLQIGSKITSNQVNPQNAPISTALIGNKTQNNPLPIGSKTVLNPINAHGSKDSIESETHEILLPIGPPPVSASITSKNATIPIASIENITHENPQIGSKTASSQVDSQNAAAPTTIGSKELEQIQNVLIEDIEVEFAQCEHFPMPVMMLSSVKKEPDDNDDQSTSNATRINIRHALFGNYDFELQEDGHALYRGVLLRSHIVLLLCRQNENDNNQFTDKKFVYMLMMELFEVAEMVQSELSDLKLSIINDLFQVRVSGETHRLALLSKYIEDACNYFAQNQRKD